MVQRKNPQTETIIRMRKEGVSYGKIAKALGISKGAVAGIVMRSNLTQPVHPSKGKQVPDYFRTIKEAKHAHPLVRRLVAEMNARRMPIYDMCDQAGVSTTAFTNWRRKHTPQLQSLEACYNVLGLTLEPIPITNEPSS